MWHKKHPTHRAKANTANGPNQDQMSRAEHSPGCGFVFSPLQPTAWVAFDSFRRSHGIKLRKNAKTVVLDFMHPARTSRRLHCGAIQTEFDTSHRAAMLSH
jgi:hypothetical protein